ncbi:helix-turn-helix transcriptional regulator [uncultured Slackia sp.]|uniref:helix-turn-helix transcriptional regulator n=1 Tax=uncultured Slackia sp. TaxID=665903 RepID=UPI0026DC5268|nr:helix-turn-helix transcriptional regulator [uncultured Slackia sp.]
MGTRMQQGVEGREAEKRRPSWLYLGFACMVASDLMSIKGFNLAGANDFLLPEGLAFSRAVLAAFMAAMLVTAVAFLDACGRRSPAHLAKGSALYAAGVVLFCIGIACVLAIDFIPGIPPYAGVAGATFIGLGNAFCMILWGRAYSGLRLSEAIVLSAACLVLGLALSVAALLAFQNHGQAFLWIAFQIGACATLRGLLAGANGPLSLAESLAADGVKVPRFADALVGFVRDEWIVLFGFGIFCFVFGVYWARNLSMVFYDSLLEVVISLFVAALIALLAKRCDAGRFNGFRDVAVPAASLLLLVDPFLATLNVGVDLASSIFLSACFIILGVANWVSVVRQASAAPLFADSFFAVDLACCAAPFLLGMLFCVFVDFESLRVVVSAVVVAFVIVALAVFVRRGEGSKETGGSDDSGDMQKKLRQLAEQHALSPRESEVLSYLAQGRGAKYIADELVVSLSTVQTHRKHIYKKLGVGSREELLDLVSRL